MTTLMRVLMVLLGGMALMLAAGACLMPGGMQLALVLLLGGAGLWGVAAVMPE